MASKNPEKIDVHKVKVNYSCALERLREDSSICEENRNLILKYLNDCSLGKTLLSRQKKRIREKRLIKYLYTLKRINYWLGNKDFRNISQEEMEQFISLLEANRLKFKNQIIEYAEWSRRDIKVCLKKFYKWLLGNGKDYPSLVSWVDTQHRTSVEAE